MIFLRLFYEFFKIGLFTFGGGYAMIPLVKEITISNDWLTESEILDFIGVSEMTPGPVAINMATFVGSSQKGFVGAVITTCGVVLPAFLIILLIASLLNGFMDKPKVKAILKGIKPVIVGLILGTGVYMLFDNIILDGKSFDFNLKAFLMTSILFIVYYGTKFIFKKKINPILMIILSALLGLIFYI